MSLPRRLLPGQSHFTTRRVRARCAFLLPTPEVKAIVLYALARAQQLAPGVQIHGLTLEVTHKHDAVTDAQDKSQLPVFYREFHTLVARALNAHYGRGENLWRTESYDNVETHTQADFEAQLLYLWAQPVKDGLVPRPEDWPGVLFLPEDFGTTLQVPRPESAFFGGRRPKAWEPTHPAARRAHRRARRLAERRKRKEAARRDKRRGRGKRRRRQLEAERRRRPSPVPPPGRVRNTLPEVLPLTISPPPGYEHLGLAGVRRHFRKLLDAHVAKLQAERREFMGIERAMAQSPWESVGDTFPSFARNPRIACKNTSLRKALLRGLQAWRSAYREALARWRAKDKAARFPWGAYLLPAFHGAETDEPVRGPPVAA